MKWSMHPLIKVGVRKRECSNHGKVAMLREYNSSVKKLEWTPRGRVSLT